ncbi:MAG: hypothetical protein WA705_23135, partial [Candidatus Ozemobacteraceae bacterium]
DENPKFEIIRQPWYWFLGSVASLRKGGRIPSELVDGFSGIRISKAILDINSKGGEMDEIFAGSWKSVQPFLKE